MQIISADERLREERGAKILILGPHGVGKTSLLRTIDPAHSLFLDIEAGDLAILDLPVPTVRLDDWPTACDLACCIGGPNKSFPPTARYSQAHYESVRDALKNDVHGVLEHLDQINNLFVDSITALTRISYRWAEQQPEAFSERTGRRDVRGAYGLHGREMVLWLNQLQHARQMNVIFVGILERTTDEFNRAEWQLQAEGAKTSRELPGIVDEIITYQFLDFGDGKPPTRGFVCTNPNPWAYPAKDRSGRLEQIEEPNLGKLLTKLTNHQARPTEENWK
jgi:hypothetical protein